MNVVVFFVVGSFHIVLFDITIRIRYMTNSAKSPGNFDIGGEINGLAIKIPILDNKHNHPGLRITATTTW
jgi:hypothetical protein